MDVDVTSGVMGNSDSALSNWVNGTQKVGYVETTSTVVTGGHSISDSISVGTTTTQSYCSSCSSYYWGWPHSCNHYITPFLVSPPIHEHHYVQAQAPHESTIFCEGCGDMKRLKAGKKESI